MDNDGEVIVPAKQRITRPYRIFGLLWVTRRCEAQISSLLSGECGIPEEAIQRGLHLTVYEARRPIPGVIPVRQSVKVAADIAETRFMVLAPGGENPRPELEPTRRSVGIRLTRRNQAIDPILGLRRNLYVRETTEVTKNRKATTDWTNAFGARHYQPHIKLLQPGSGVDRDLTKIGEVFRDRMSQIDFGKFEIRVLNDDRQRQGKGVRS